MDFNYIGMMKSKINGPGKRDFVVLANCPLNCKYCINRLDLEGSFTNLSPNELISMIEKDYDLFRKYNSGVTFGGGEALLQYKQILEFDKIFPKEFTILIETSLNVSPKYFNFFLNNINLERILFLIDIKDINNEIYEKYTGVSNKNVIYNLKLLSGYGYQDKCKIRIPYIKKFNTIKDMKKSREYLYNLGFRDFQEFKYMVMK